MLSLRNANKLLDITSRDAVKFRVQKYESMGEERVDKFDPLAEERAFLWCVPEKAD